MLDKVGFIAAILGTIIGGVALCFIVAAVMYIGIYVFAGAVGKGQSTDWEDVFPLSLFVDGEVRNSPRVLIRGEKINGGCSFSVGLSVSGGAASGSVSTHTVWQDHAKCEQLMEIRSGPIQP